MSQQPPFDIDALLVTMWHAFIADVTDPPPPSLSQATDLLQTFAPDVTDTEGDAFFNAMAQLYLDVGLTANNQYLTMRAKIVSDGESTSQTAFGVLKFAVGSLTAFQPVSASLAKKSMEDEVNTTIPADISTIETHRDAQTDQVLIDALNDGIARKNQRKTRLNTFLGN